MDILNELCRVPPREHQWNTHFKCMSETFAVLGFLAFLAALWCACGSSRFRLNQSDRHEFSQACERAEERED